MRPTPIPDHVFIDRPRKVIGVGGEGESIDDIVGDVRPVEAIIDHDDKGPMFGFHLVLDPGDLERLAAGEPIWLTMWGHVVPWSVVVGGEG